MKSGGAIRSGLVMEFSVPSGLGYAQYVGTHKRLGASIWVLCERRQARPEALDELHWDEGFYIFYPVRAALDSGLVAPIGIASTADRAVPIDMIRRGAIDRHGNVRTWVVNLNGVDFVREEPSIDEKQLPFASIWNHETLVRYVEEGRTPMDLFQ